MKELEVGHPQSLPGLHAGPPPKIGAFRTIRWWSCTGRRWESSATARGELVDEAALADELNAGRLAGAGLDVLSMEPPMEANPLLSARNCLITPHLAWATREARSRLMGATVENVRAFLAGSPKNVVS